MNLDKNHKQQTSLGFTLIELLVVISIIGILTSFALPHFSTYKQNAFDLEAQVELRNVALAEESYFVLSEEYFPCQNRECKKLPGIVRYNDNIEIKVLVNEDRFIGSSSHHKGSGKIFNWDSQNGGFS